jgi:chorismate--pyruvate lyase
VYFAFLAVFLNVRVVGSCCTSSTAYERKPLTGFNRAQMLAMAELKPTSRSIVKPVEWRPLGGTPPDLSPSIRGWLLTEESMTKHFEQHCSRVHVEMYQCGYITADDLGDDASLLPACSRYWLREITLFGDGTPWLFGRTLIPSSSPNVMDVVNLGTVPLGHYLFNGKHKLGREYIQIGLQDEGIYARRSLLRVSGEPLLLTEVFLPASPIYRGVAPKGQSDSKQ